MSSKVTTLSAFVLDGKGGCLPATPEEIGQGRSARGPLWMHLDYQDPTVRAWLQRQSLPSTIIEALTTAQPRPRSVIEGDGLMVILRGINVNDGAEADDMVSLRLWFEADRILTLRHRPVAAVRDISKTLTEGLGPIDPGGVLHDVVDHLLDRIGAEVTEIEDTIDAIEEELLVSGSREIRPRLSELRRTSIALRRYLAPQRETIGRMHAERVTWLTDETRAHLREAADRMTRYVETLDASRERAAVSYEELSSRLAEQMNQTMYILSVVAAIFLPLGLLTGLLGINVGGMPGVESSMAFTIVTVLLVVLGFAEYLFLRALRVI